MKTISVQFNIRLCCDILFGVFCFANRRQLAKLERIGRRFRLIVDGYFVGAPYLLFKLQTQF